MLQGQRIKLVDWKLAVMRRETDSLRPVLDGRPIAVGGGTAAYFLTPHMSKVEALRRDET
jgi:hypothetical protein